MALANVLAEHRLTILDEALSAFTEECVRSESVGAQQANGPSCIQLLPEYGAFLGTGGMGNVSRNRELGAKRHESQS